MANNLFVSYDLINPGQNYGAVIDAVKGLGEWAKVHKSLWYVNSSYSASDAHDVVRTEMDQNDKLLVIDATNNNAAWTNLSDEVSDFIQEQWNQ